MNAAFTIVAKNYVGLAQSLVKSIKQFNPDLHCYIIVADEIEDQSILEGADYTILQAKSMDIPSYDSLAFKYNITEFCTAIKPFAFKYLFARSGYDKLIYFDPDIFVYHDLNMIYDELNDKFALLTPHYITPETVYTGNAPESLTLFAGIYNLGFLALRHSANTDVMLDWWMKRLSDLCYADKFDALHVDQKWIDFIPAFFGNDIIISRHLGYNIAYWNIHERQMFERDGKWYVRNRIRGNEESPLVFIHFSGVDPRNIHLNKQCPTLDLYQYADWLPFVEDYSRKTLEDGFEKFFNLKYSYLEFDNGQKIAQFHRRLFRRLLDKGYDFKAPFGTTDGTFYKQLEKSKLLVGKDGSIDKMNERNFGGFEKKLGTLNRLLRLLKIVIGTNRYILLTKFCQRYLRPENQIFLLHDFKNEVSFINENINKKQ